MEVVCFVMLTYIRRGTARRIFIQKIQITNKIIRRMHKSYDILYTQGTPTSTASVSPDEGIRT
jgi:hypothetical protein